MAGLLDFTASPIGQGLLAAGFAGLAGANRRTPINNIGRAGLAGLAGYSAAGALQATQRKQQEADRLKAAIPTLYKQAEDGSITFDKMGAINLGFDAPTINDLSKVPDAGRAEVKRTIDVTGANGQKQTLQYDAFGNQVGTAIDAYVAPQLVDTGDAKQFVTPTAGQSFSMGMSPTERDNSARGWANVGLRREENDISRDANRIMEGLKAQEKALQVEELQGKREERNRSKEAQRASIAAQIGVIDKALNHPGRTTATGLSGSIDPRNYLPATDARDFQVLLDQIGGTAFLQAFESLKGGGQITEMEGKKATDAIARLNRAQSDREFEQSLRDLRDVMESGRQRLGGAQAQQPASTTAPAPFDAEKEARYQAWKRQQGIQ